MTALQTNLRTLVVLLSGLAATGGCGGGSVPADVPVSDGVEEPLPSDAPEEPVVPANAPPPAPMGSDEVPDVPPAD